MYKIQVFEGNENPNIRELVVLNSLKSIEKLDINPNNIDYKENSISFESLKQYTEISFICLKDKNIKHTYDRDNMFIGLGINKNHIEEYSKNKEAVDFKETQKFIQEKRDFKNEIFSFLDKEKIDELILNSQKNKKI